MILRSTQSLRGRRLLIVAGLAASSMLVGCDNQTATSRALDQARMELVALSSGETLAPSEHRAEVYKTTLANLEPVASRGTRGENAAAALLIAQIHAGLAEAPMATAVDVEAKALHLKNAVRSKLSQWSTLSATAAGAAAYDPAPELSDIQQSSREREQKIAELETKKKEIEARAADLRSQAQAKAQQARSLNQEAGRLRQQVANQTAVEGEQSLMSAREIARRADGLEVEAAQLTARAEQIEPDIVEYSMRIDGLRDEIDGLAKSTAEVQARASRARDEASAARTRATAMAQELHATVQELASLRSDELEPLYEAAIAGFQRSAESARIATTDNRVASNLAIGTAQQAVGALHWGRSHGLAFYHETLNALSEAEAALPQAQQYRQMVQEVAGERQAALDAATEAFEAALNAFQASGAGEGMDRVTSALRDIVLNTSGGSRDLGSAAGAGGTGSPSQAGLETEWAGLIEPGETPQETLSALAAGAAAGDPAIIDLFYVDGPEQREVLESLIRIFPAYQRFAEALTNQFGAEAAEGLQNMSAQAPGMMDLANFDPSMLDIDIAGDRAEAQLGDGERIKLREVDGRWLVDVSEDLSGPEAEMMSTMMPQVRKAFDDLADDIEAGHFENEQEVFSALMMKMMSGFGGG